MYDNLSLKKILSCVPICHFHLHDWTSNQYFSRVVFVPDITSDNKNDMKFTKLSTNQYILSCTKKYYHDYFLMNSWIHTFDRGYNLI